MNRSVVPMIASHEEGAGEWRSLDVFSALIAAIFLPLLSSSARPVERARRSSVCLSLSLSLSLSFLYLFVRFFFLPFCFFLSFFLFFFSFPFYRDLARSYLPGPRKNRRDAQETAVAASLHSLISRAEEEPLHSEPLLRASRVTAKYAIIRPERLLYRSCSALNFLSAYLSIQR